MTPLLTKLLKGSDTRATRLHDEKGNIISLPNLVLHGPAAFTSCLSRLVFEKRPVLPWLSYSAIKDINALITKESVILEFGSGMSTIWFAKRCQYVYSVENDENWYKFIYNLLRINKTDNVFYEFRNSCNYAQFPENEDLKFDFILIDGINRLECLQTAIKHRNHPCMIYIDNIDNQDQPMRMAEKFIVEYAGSNNGTLKYYTDFFPTYLFVIQGVLACLP